MKDTIKNLRKEKSNLVNKLDDITTALNSLKSLYKHEEIPLCVHETIDLFQSQSDNLITQIKGYTQAIKGFQSACTHKHADGSNAMVYTGHDSHKSYYKCSICGYEDDY